MSITPFPSQGQYPWYDQLEQWGADTQAAAENAKIAADQVHADVAASVSAATQAALDAQAAQVAATNAAGLVDAPAGNAVKAAISEGGAARGELSAAIDTAIEVAEVSKASMSTVASPAQGLEGPTPAMQFTGTTAYISAPGSKFDATDDIDIRVLLAMDDWTPTPASGTTMTIASRGKDTGASQFKFEINNLGMLVFRWSPTGSSSFTAKSSFSGLGSMPNGSPLWVRVAFDVDNGNGESEIFFYTSSNGVNWVPLGPSVKTAGVVDFVASSDPLQIGAYATVASAPLTGRVSEVIVLDGIYGEPLGHFKAAELPYTDPQGNVWSLTGEGITLVEQPASTLTTLPGRVNNDWLYNAASYANNLTEWGGYQFAAYWGADRYGRIARRALGSKAWNIFSLQNLTGLLAAQVAADGHNTVAIHADADGYLHVAGNMHGDWLKYMRSTAPGGYMGWEYPGMIRGTGSKTGTDEGLVTYPRFFTNPATGQLFFMYRNGASGNGNTYLNKYDTATKTWSRVCQLFDGAATNESAYENTPVFDEAGTLHLSYTWAASGSGFNDRTDVCYMKSTDGGQTFKTITGAAVALPVTHTTAPVILPAGSGDGLLNQTGMAVDAKGFPHIAHFWAPDGNRNIWHLYWDGAAWQHERVTDFTKTGLDWTGLSRPAIIHYAGRLLVLWRHQFEGWRGKLWATDVSTPGKKQHHILADVDLREWEPAPDYRAIRRGSLNLLLTRSNGALPGNIPGYGEADWKKQTAGVLTVDLSRFDQRTIHRLPKDKPTDP